MTYWFHSSLEQIYWPSFDPKHYPYKIYTGSKTEDTTINRNRNNQTRICIYTNHVFDIFCDCDITPTILAIASIVSEGSHFK
jgi:hypothetical protein